MKNISLKNYTTDKYYPKIAKAVDAELRSRNFVTPIEVFISIGLFERRDVENWRAGRIAYLEQVSGAISQRRAASCAYFASTPMT